MSVFLLTLYQSLGESLVKQIALIPSVGYPLIPFHILRIIKLLKWYIDFRLESFIAIAAERQVLPASAGFGR